MWKYFVYYPLPFFLIKKLTKKSTCPCLWSGGCEIMPIIMIAAPSRHKMAQFPSLHKINELASISIFKSDPSGSNSIYFLTAAVKIFIHISFKVRHSKNTDVWIEKLCFWILFIFFLLYWWRLLYLFPPSK